MLDLLSLSVLCFRVPMLSIDLLLLSSLRKPLKCCHIYPTQCIFQNPVTGKNKWWRSRKWKVESILILWLMLFQLFNLGGRIALKWVRLCFDIIAWLHSLVKFEIMLPSLFSTKESISLQHDAWQLGKHTRSAFLISIDKKSNKIFFFIHSDVWNPLKSKQYLFLCRKGFYIAVIFRNSGADLQSY